MSDKIKAAIITGLCSLAVGVIAAFFGASQYYQNQSVIVNVNGEQVTVTPEKYREMIDEIDYLKSKIDNDESKSKTVSKPNKSDYLVYMLEPYSFNRNYEKIIDSTMKMGGKEYNNGFSFAGSYSTGIVWYNLEGRYTSLSGIIGYQDPGDDKNVNVEFWGDDKLIYTVIVKAHDLPKDFAVDVSNVKKLEIKTSEYTVEAVNLAELILK